MLDTDYITYPSHNAFIEVRSFLKLGTPEHDFYAFNFESIYYGLNILRAWIPSLPKTDDNKHLNGFWGTNANPFLVFLASHTSWLLGQLSFLYKV